MSDEEIVDPDANPYFQKVKELAELEHNEVVPVCAKIEEELSELDKEEKTEFLNELGIQESGLDKDSIPYSGFVYLPDSRRG